jgi:hypothetical protein
MTITTRTLKWSDRNSQVSLHAGVHHLQRVLGVSERFACHVVGRHRTTQRHQPNSATLTDERLSFAVDQFTDPVTEVFVMSPRHAVTNVGGRYSKVITGGCRLPISAAHAGRWGTESTVECA